jgi:fructose-1,6-bisphosphatase-3
MARSTFDETELLALQALSRQIPNVDAAVARIALLKAQLALPKGPVHVFTDIHGEHGKLRHLINNVSGKLRRVVVHLFEGRLTAEERELLLSVLYYPRETMEELSKRYSRPDDMASLVGTLIHQQVELVRYLARNYPMTRVIESFPLEYREVLTELVVAPVLHREPYYVETLLNGLRTHNKGVDFIRHVSHVVRNLIVDEIIIGGDMGDRGPRIDKVIHYLMKQPNVSLIWGNHDTLWMGASLGHEALIATAIRISMRYGRLDQIEEGYGIPLDPLRHLAVSVYADDPCARFTPKEVSRFAPHIQAKMEKAIAMIQFKLEGQMLARYPEWGMEDRRLLHRLDLEGGTVEVDGRRYPLEDRLFPTLDPSDPYALSAEERGCMDALRSSFLHSPVLYKQMDFLFRKGTMYTVRDDCLFFHGAVPVHETEVRQAFSIRGTYYRGKELFDAFELAVHRSWREKHRESVDLLWYLWAGPLSPIFAKSKMATFESYFIKDKEVAKEHKNAYYKLIDDPRFARSVLREFGVDPERGMIVNGHIPVKLEKGENPVKAGGAALNLDGGFAVAYGGRGLTLGLERNRTWLATHGTFTKVEDYLCGKGDMVPEVQDLRTFVSTRRVGDTEDGERVRREIGMLERLLTAYRENRLQESFPSPR